MSSNFPQNLNITPSTHPSVKLSGVFADNAQREAINRYGIAGRVWESAFLMSFYVDPSPNYEFDPPFPGSPSPRTIIELGSGMGMVAAAIANVLNAHEDLMIATDLPEICPLLERNLLTSQATLVRALIWGDNDSTDRLVSEIFSGPDARKLTHIICSDLVYFPALLAPLLRTLIQLTSEAFVRDWPQPMVVISYKIRSLVKESPFWSAFGLWFDFKPVLAKVRPILNGPHDGEEVEEVDWHRFRGDVDGDMFIFIAHRRSESLSWKVAMKDHDLLNGVYARGSSERKGDDTFENLLLLSLQ